MISMLEFFRLSLGTVSCFRRLSIHFYLTHVTLIDKLKRAQDKLSEIMTTPDLEEVDTLCSMTRLVCQEVGDIQIRQIEAESWYREVVHQSRAKLADQHGHIKAINTVLTHQGEVLRGLRTRMTFLQGGTLGVGQRTRCMHLCLNGRRSFPIPRAL